MTKKPNIHVVPSGKTDSGKPTWQVKPEGGAPISNHRTQRTAEEAGRIVARRNQSEIVIHGRDGKIRDKDSYGNDPHPPKDQKH